MIRTLGAALFRRLNFFSSIRGKITFTLLALTFTAGGAGYLTYQSFDQVSIRVAEMTTDNMPKMTQSNALMAAASKAKTAMVHVMMSRNSDDLTSVSTNIATSLAALRKAILDLPQAEFIAALAQVSGTLATSLQSRGRIFEYSARVGAMTNRL